MLRLLEDSLRAGPAGLALIEGEPGIGKTRLLAELPRRAADFDSIVINLQ